MGDRSVHQTVLSLAQAQAEHEGNHRNIIAHAMLVPEQDFALMGKLKLICAVQPRWMTYDTDIEEFNIPFFGETRALDCYPNKRLRDSGCVVSYGTDFPVTPPPDPWHEIQCGMTRTLFPDAPDYEAYKGRVLAPPGKEDQDKVNLDESIASLTVLGAYQNFLEDITGSIEPGKSADLVILDCDIESIPAEEIYKASVAFTLFKGAVVFKKE
jgi:predicted amidohydrolase YtcJ